MAKESGEYVGALVVMPSSSRMLEVVEFTDFSHQSIAKGGRAAEYAHGTGHTPSAW